MDGSSRNNPFVSPSGNSCPIHKLPAEILSYIFELVADGLRSRTAATDTSEYYMDHTLTRKVTDSDALTPWLPVSDVCRRWHDLALSTPSLWTVVIVPPTSGPPLCRSGSPFYRISRQLEQSKCHPIDILIRLDVLYPGYLVPMIFGGLLEQVDRWRSIEVQVVLAEHMHHGILYRISQEISRKPNLIASQLTSVVLACREPVPQGKDYIYKFSKDFALFGSSAPRLETISLTGVNIDWNQAWISSASNLTTLRVMIGDNQEGPSWAEFSAILRGAPQLKVLIFENGNEVLFERVDPAWADPNIGSTSGGNSMIPVELPELKRLDISLPTAMLAQFLRRCYTPSLTRLTIQPLFEEIRQGYYRRAPELEHLQLVGPLAVTGTSSEVRLPLAQAQSHSMLSAAQHLCTEHFQEFGAEGTDALYRKLNGLASLSQFCWKPRIRRSCVHADGM